MQHLLVSLLLMLALSPAAQAQQPTHFAAGSEAAEMRAVGEDPLLPGEDALRLYPNPANGTLKVAYKAPRVQSLAGLAQPTTLQTLDLAGNELQRLPFSPDSNDTLQVDISALEPAVYQIVATNDLGARYTQRLLLR